MSESDTTTPGAAAPVPTLDDLQDEIRIILDGWLAYEMASDAANDIVEAICLDALLTRLADAEAGLPARCSGTADLLRDAQNAALTAQVSRLEEDLSRAIGQAGDNGCTANHWARQAELKDEALDEIALTVGYIVLHHGTMTTQDLADTITRIGNIARAARDGHSVKEGAGHD